MTQPPATMDHFNRHFRYAPQYHVVVCRACRFAIPPDKIDSHMKVTPSHRCITKEQRSDIVRFVETIPNVAMTPADVAFPHPDDPPCDMLPVRVGGFRCTASVNDQQCPQVTGRVTKMQEHCKVQHGWVNCQKRGGNVRSKSIHAANRMWEEGQAYQQFFAMPPWKRYTAVKPSTPAASQEGEDDREKQADRLIAEQEAIINDMRNRRTIQGSIHRFEATSWLQFTAWHRHLGGFDRGGLLLHIRPADGERDEDGLASLFIAEDEEAPGLWRACKATRRLIRKAFASARPHIVGRAALEAMNRRETGAASNERPFYAEQKVKTLRKYSRSWVKILRYIWRTAGREGRPRYILTPKQEHCLERLQHIVAGIDDGEVDGSIGNGHSQTSTTSAITDAAAIEQASLEFWLAMLDHELKDEEFESGIISGLAVLGLEVEKGGWMPAINYTPILSAIVTVARALVVYQAYQSRQQAIQRDMARGSSEAEAKQSAPAIVHGVDEMAERFMRLRVFGGMISPMDRVLKQRTFGLAIRYTTKAEGRVSWNGKDILVDNKRFSMDDIRTVVHGLNETVRQRLHRDLLFVKWDDMPPIDIGSLADNPVEISEGWSFLSDARNKFAVDGQRWMWRRLFREGEVQQKFIQGDIDSVERREDIQWNEGGVEDYFRQIRRFKEELLVLVHMSAGAPARATELISIHRENGPEARSQRGVFIDDGMVSFVTSYHKGFGKSQDAKIIHRYVPREVGELVVYYMWLVEPFVQQLQTMSRDRMEFTPWFWEPRPDEEWELDEDEDAEELTSRHAEEDDAGSEGGGEDEDGDAEDIGPDTGPKSVDGYYDTDRVRRVMYRETESRIGVPIGVALWRQAYPAIQREMSRDVEVRKTLDVIYERQPTKETTATTVEDIRAQQAGHGRYMEEMIYGLLLSESPFTTMSEREQFRQVSMDWHRLLHFQSAWEKSTVEPNIQRKMDAEREAAELRRWHQMRDIDIDVQLKKFYDSPDARFRGLQQEGLEAIVGGRPFILIIMRTGGGKSLMFMLPASASIDGLTIVIVPMVSLRQDLWERSNEKGIPCAEWDGTRPPYHARIIFITPEAALTKAFGRFMDEKRAAQQLERIVIDECHMILESTPKWRPKMRELYKMTTKGVQVVFLTATLPPCDEAAFFDMVRVPEQKMHVLRDSTVRSNISYKVVAYTRQEEDAAVRQLVEEKLAKYPEPGQIIVYCRKIDQARRLAKVLGCSVYHRTVGDNVVKEGILRRLTGQSERVFTATNALGVGIDAPTIRVVIHVGICAKMSQYSQESGRAGRDGESSEAIMMRAEWTDGDGKVKKEMGWRLDGAIKGYLKGDRCRRIALDGHIDGRTGRTNCEVGEEGCDVCSGHAGIEHGRRMMVRNELQEVTGEMAGQKRRAEEDKGALMQMATKRQVYYQQERQIREKAMADARAGEAFEQRLRGWQGLCTICQIFNRKGEGHTDWQECPGEEHNVAETRLVWEWLGTIEFEEFSGCRECWVPQGICQAWKGRVEAGAEGFSRSEDGKCQFPGLIRNVVAAATGVGNRDLISDFVKIEAGKIGLREEEGVGQWDVWKAWFGRRTKIGEVETSGIGRLFYEFGDR